MQREGRTKSERPGEDNARAGIMTRGEARTAEGITATILVRTLMSEDSDDRINNRLSGETKRPEKWQIAVKRVATIAGTVIIDAVKELS